MQNTDLFHFVEELIRNQVELNLSRRLLSMKPYSSGIRYVYCFYITSIKIMTVQTVDNVTEFVSAKLKKTVQCVEHMVGKCKYACANSLPSLLTARKQSRIPFLALAS